MTRSYPTSPYGVFLNGASTILQPIPYYLRYRIIIYHIVDTTTPVFRNVPTSYKPLETREEGAKEPPTRPIRDY